MKHGQVCPEHLQSTTVSDLHRFNTDPHADRHFTSMQIRDRRANSKRIHTKPDPYTGFAITL
jgi:hypothetical protein